MAGATGLREPAVENVGIAALGRELAAGPLTSVELVRAYLARIDAIDRSGPSLRAVIALDPDAGAQAAASDQRRRRGAAVGPLDGVPILVKDNVEVAGSMPTTAGSMALARNVTGRDAPLVARLRAAGAIILGKTNLSEWANFRSSSSISGWSGVGGLTRNPFALDRTACGSSSGSAAAVAASLAAASVGTETDGSITCPASMTGLVGLKPTVGLVSRTHIVPISPSQDTPGPTPPTPPPPAPVTHDVADAALLLAVMAGTDPSDPATRDADAHRPGFRPDPHSLRGQRIGVARFLAGHHAATDRVFEHALDVLRDAGAVLVEVTDGPDLDAIGRAEMTVLLAEFKSSLNVYLATVPAAVTSRHLADIIAFNIARQDRELGLFGQDLMEKAEATAGLEDPAYVEALATGRRLAGPEGIDRLLREHHLAALVGPTGGPAWVIDTIDGDHDGPAASTIPAVAGYPHLTVPMGDVAGLPVGISFIGPAWSEQRLLEFGYAFEQRAQVRKAPTYARTVGTSGLLLPLDGNPGRAPFGGAGN